jgi:hypothetical protein
MTYLLGNDREIRNYTTAVTMQRPVNNRGVVFSVQTVSIAVQAPMEYVILSSSNNCTAIEEWYFVRRPCRDVIIEQVRSFS